MIKPRPLGDKEHVLLFHQHGIPECENRGVVTQDSDRLMNITLPHRSQIAEAREETPGMEGRLPLRGGGRLVHWLIGRDWARRRQKLYVVERAGVGRTRGGPGSRAAFPGLFEGCANALGGRGGPEEALIDDENRLRRVNNARSLCR